MTESLEEAKQVHGMKPMVEWAKLVDQQPAVIAPRRRHWLDPTLGPTCGSARL